MVAVQFLLGAALAAARVSASTDQLQLFSRLLKRQEPGTPAYDCHNNCGQAIIEARQSDDVCTDDIFLTDYANCLQCSGPDNENIWQYYGTTLKTAAASCGLSTTPLSGEQDAVGEAIIAGSTSTSTTAAAETTTTTAAETTSTATTETTETSTAGSSTVESTASATATATSTVGETSITVTSASSAPVVTSATYTGTYSVTGTYSATGTGKYTATSTSGVVQVTGAANALSGNTLGVFGAVVFGAMYAVAQ
ncbi:uncharacterized protein BCR38DRAFT_124869 [Pseudomassariella vexata]|uniref:Uncharacterized protein n=1 Tax=Pseudomassariella vexata TaxID=1141098 RepID=A0A1Y2D8M1_9PEZI|nr:uncharacterized protein BCR38DRAFT_124869 [Pseudomassariella vexata]ORY55476.1 hypothetical protein BCR38DRAFT_124869 [Pseudomassariella vexata]